MKLTPQELKQIVSLTLDQYNHGAEDFWEGTRGHDVSQNIAALLQLSRAIREGPLGVPH